MFLLRSCDYSCVLRVPWGEVTSCHATEYLLQSDWFWTRNSDVTTSWGRRRRVGCLSLDYQNHQICLPYNSLGSQVLGTIFTGEFLFFSKLWPGLTFSKLQVKKKQQTKQNTNNTKTTWGTPQTLSYSLFLPSSCFSRTPIFTHGVTSLKKESDKFIHSKV